MEMLEQGELEESTPVHRMKLQQRRQMRERYSNPKLVHQPTYAFEDNTIEKLY